MKIIDRFASVITIMKSMARRKDVVCVCVCVYVHYVAVEA